MNPIERAKIQVNKSTLSKKELRRIPYGAILTTTGVWAIWIAALGNFYAVNTLFLYARE